MHHLVEVTRKNFRINGQRPDMLIAKLSHELQEGIYPICMKLIHLVDELGSAILKKLNRIGTKENLKFKNYTKVLDWKIL